MLQIAACELQHLMLHFCEIEHVINEYKLQILGLSETRLSEGIRDPEVGLEGFEIHHKDRKC